MAAKSAERKGENGREDATFEEEDEGQRGYACVSGRAHSGGNEDDNHRPTKVIVSDSLP